MSWTKTLWAGLLRFGKTAGAPVSPAAPEPEGAPEPEKEPPKSFWRFLVRHLPLLIMVLIPGVLALAEHFLESRVPARIEVPQPVPEPPFDPGARAVLPKHRVVAFYGIPGATVAGPAYTINEKVLEELKAQGAAYEALDKNHPVKLGIDLVTSVPDGFPGPKGYYSHHLARQTLDAYVEFCRQNDLLLFLDLSFGRAPVMDEVKWVLPLLQKYDFVHLAIDPEWAFPRRLGVPGVNIGQLDAQDINPIIDLLATLPYEYKIPRKIFLIHQFRDDVLAHKGEIKLNPLVDTVLHLDSVGGFPGDIQTKTIQYDAWINGEMDKYQNFKYGGFKIFSWLEAKTRIMTPAEVLDLEPSPMVITYGH